MNIDVKEYLQTHYQENQLQVSKSLGTYITSLDLPLSKNVMDLVFDIQHIVPSFSSAFSGQFTREIDDEYQYTPEEYVTRLDCQISKLLDENVYSDPVEKAWISTLLLVQMMSVFGGIKCFELFNNPSLPQSAFRRDALGSFYKLLSDFDSVFDQINVFSRDSEMMWSTHPIYEESAHHRKPKSKKADEPVEPIESVEPADEIQKPDYKYLAAVIGNALHPSSSISDFEKELTSIIEILKFEYEQGLVNSHLKPCLEALHKMSLISRVLLVNIVHPMYTPLQNVVFFVDMNTFLVRSFWKNYALALEVR